MTTLPISEARDHLADLGNRVALRGERIVVERRGKDLFAMVPVEDLDMLERLEDRFDLETIRRRLGEQSVPWEQLRKKLGL
ncbi:MAG: type II toxin-antitoxin system Phd/YefM family antitoxin [Phycisphaerae bacterium]|nr:type II toxin-antitoxin system Phd/YefM family antitoxin [Phycisphaerae bacterium]